MAESDPKVLTVKVCLSVALSAAGMRSHYEEKFTWYIFFVPHKSPGADIGPFIYHYHSISACMCE